MSQSGLWESSCEVDDGKAKEQVFYCRGEKVKDTKDDVMVKEVNEAKLEHSRPGSFPFPLILPRIRTASRSFFSSSRLLLPPTSSRHVQAYRRR